MLSILTIDTFWFLICVSFLLFVNDIGRKIPIIRRVVVHRF